MKKYNIDVYDKKFNVCFCEEELRKFYKKNKYEYNEEELCKGFTLYQHEKEVYLIYLNLERHKSEKDIINTVAHESYHLADTILEAKGIQYKYASGNESYAYLTGFIAEKIYDYLEIWRNKK